MEAGSVHTVIQSLSTLVSRRKDPRQLVEDQRALTIHPVPPPSFLRGTVLPGLYWLRGSKSGGEENKAIRNFYQFISACTAQGVIDSKDAAAIFGQLKTGDLRDPFLPRQIAALRTYAEVAARYSGVDGAADILELFLPHLSRLDAAIQASWRVGTLSTKQRKANVAELWSAPAVFSALARTAGTPIDFIGLRHFVGIGLQSLDVDTARAASLCLLRHAAADCTADADSETAVDSIRVLRRIVLEVVPPTWGTDASSSRSSYSSTTDAGAAPAQLPPGVHPTLAVSDVPTLVNYIDAVALLAGIEAWQASVDARPPPAASDPSAVPVPLSPLRLACGDGCTGDAGRVAERYAASSRAAADGEDCPAAARKSAAASTLVSSGGGAELHAGFRYVCHRVARQSSAVAAGRSEVEVVRAVANRLPRRATEPAAFAPHAAPPSSQRAPLSDALSSGGDQEEAALLHHPAGQAVRRSSSRRSGGLIAHADVVAKGSPTGPQRRSASTTSSGGGTSSISRAAAAAAASAHLAEGGASAAPPLHSSRRSTLTGRSDSIVSSSTAAAASPSLPAVGPPRAAATSLSLSSSVKAPAAAWSIPLGEDRLSTATHTLLHAATGGVGAAAAQTAAIDPPLRRTTQALPPFRFTPVPAWLTLSPLAAQGFTPAAHAEPAGTQRRLFNPPAASGAAHPQLALEAANAIGDGPATAGACYGVLLSALADARPRVLLAACRQLVAGGLPRLLAHTPQAAGEASDVRGWLPGGEGARAVAEAADRGAASVVNFLAVSRRIALCLHTGCDVRNMPLIMSSLRAAVAFGVAHSAFEAAALRRLRRAVRRAHRAAHSPPPPPAEVAPLLSPTAPADALAAVFDVSPPLPPLLGGSAAEGMWVDTRAVQGAAAVAATGAALVVVLDALARCLSAVLGGETHPGMTPAFVALSHKAVAWCTPSLALALPAEGAPCCGRGDAPGQVQFLSSLLGELGLTTAGRAARTTARALCAAMVGSAPRVRTLRSMHRAAVAMLQDAVERCPPAALLSVFQCCADKAALFRSCGGGPFPRLLPTVALAWTFRSLADYGRGCSGKDFAPRSTHSPAGPELPPMSSNLAVRAASTLGGGLCSTYAIRRGTWSTWGPRPRPMPPPGWYCSLVAGREACLGGAAAYNPLLQAAAAMGRPGPSLVVEALDFLRLMGAVHGGGGDRSGGSPPAPGPIIISSPLPLAPVAADDSDPLGIASLLAAAAPTSGGGKQAMTTSRAALQERARYWRMVAATVQALLQRGPAPSVHACHSIATAAMSIITPVVAGQQRPSAYGTAVSGRRLREVLWGVTSARPLTIALRSTPTSGFVVGGLQPTVGAQQHSVRAQEQLVALAGWYVRRYGAAQSM